MSGKIEVGMVVEYMGPDHCVRVVVTTDPMSWRYADSPGCGPFFALKYFCDRVTFRRWATREECAAAGIPFVPRDAEGRPLPATPAQAEASAEHGLGDTASVVDPALVDEARKVWQYEFGDQPTVYARWCASKVREAVRDANERADKAERDLAAAWKESGTLSAEVAECRARAEKAERDLASARERAEKAEAAVAARDARIKVLEGERDREKRNADSLSSELGAMIKERDAEKQRADRNFEGCERRKRRIEELRAAVDALKADQAAVPPDALAAWERERDILRGKCVDAQAEELDAQRLLSIYSNVHDNLSERSRLDAAKKALELASNALAAHLASRPEGEVARG